MRWGRHRRWGRRSPPCGAGRPAGRRATPRPPRSTPWSLHVILSLYDVLGELAPDRVRGGGGRGLAVARLHVSRKFEREGRPGSGPAPQGHQAVVVLGDVLDDRQAQPGPPGVPGAGLAHAEEAREDATEARPPRWPGSGPCPPQR